LGRKIKLNNVIDGADESEALAATKSQINEWYDTYRTIKQGDPLEAREPTPDQLAALHQRIIVLGMEPYADFSLLTPFGRRMAKVLRHRSWLLQEDGTYKPIEVPGPECLETWEACFAVYEVILLMLRFPEKGAVVATPIALETYYQSFRQLARDFPECWHLCQRAEDRCRAEHFPRLYRRLLDSKGVEPTWGEVFIAAAQDDRYWDREVRRPAVNFLARHKRPHSGTVFTSSAAEHMVEQRAAESGHGGSAKRARHQNGQHQREGGKSASSHQPQPQRKAKGKGKQHSGKGPHPRCDHSGRFTTTRDGAEVCFAFAAGGHDKCKGPCSKGRAHVCQFCLQPHPNSECTKRG
jgi:hypothetical protein